MALGERNVLEAYIRNTRGVDAYQESVRRGNHMNQHTSNDYNQDHEKTSLKMSSHEGVVIATVRCVIPGEYGEAISALKDAMKWAAAEIEEQGGLIGHIKAFAKENNRSCFISIPEAEDLQIKETEEPTLYVECVHIIFGMTLTELEKIVRSAFAVWLGDMYL